MTVGRAPAAGRPPCAVGTLVRVDAADAERDGATAAAVLDGGPISDAELTAQALAADPDAPLDPDAQPWPNDRGMQSALPVWYMPPAAGIRGSRRRRVVVAVLVAAFLTVSGAGLCVTYGLPEIAW